MTDKNKLSDEATRKLFTDAIALSEDMQAVAVMTCLNQNEFDLDVVRDGESRHVKIPLSPIDIDEENAAAALAEGVLDALYEFPPDKDTVLAFSQQVVRGDGTLTVWFGVGEK